MLIFGKSTLCVEPAHRYAAGVFGTAAFSVLIFGKSTLRVEPTHRYAAWSFGTAALGENERVSPQYRTSSVLAGLSGIDAVLDGHPHQIYLKTLKDKEGKEILTVQAGMKFENIGQLTVYRDGHLEEKLLQEIPASNTLPMETVVRKGKTRFVDPEMHALMNEIVRPYEAFLDRKIGTLSFDMILEIDEQHISQRYQENALCELVADA